MMNRKEFQQYLQETVKDHLPESFADATVAFNEVVKNNDTHLTGISITKPGEVIVPNIYIENFWNDYQHGRDIDEIVGDIADTRIEYDSPNMNADIASTITNYEMAKGNLQIRLCDTLENQNRLQNLVHTEHSDFSATYHVIIQEGPEGSASTAVTPQLMDIWGISIEQLHADALAADIRRDPILCDMGEMMESLMLGKKPENLLDSEAGTSMPGMGMFCLTNGDRVNGAGLLLQADVMDKIGEVVGGNFFVLPSSTHEVLIVPERTEIDVKELSAMVYQINRTEVSQEDRLSDEVQFYDTDTRVMENAEKREFRREMEKAEKSVAKIKKSIHDRLGEKKEKIAAGKAEKAAEKVEKTNKGQEL